MHDQPGQEETYEQGRPQVQTTLVVSGRLGERQEEQKPSDEECRIVGHQNRPEHEPQLNECDPKWDWTRIGSDWTHPTRFG